jgi:hypothetical protein
VGWVRGRESDRKGGLGTLGGEDGIGGRAIAATRPIRHAELMFIAEKPPRAHLFEEIVLMAAEEGRDYE